MTKDSDFKQLVRSRQRRTGESYVEARRQLRATTSPEATPPRLRASFPKSRDPHRWVATLEWNDGLIGEMVVLQRKQLRMPHDLEHYVVDAVLRHDYAFWPLLAEYGPFKSVRLVNGNWGRRRLENFQAVLRDHGSEIDAAETLTAPVRAIVHHDLSGPAAEQVFRSSPAKERFEGLTREQLDTLVDRYRLVEAEWERCAPDVALVVEWPPTRQP